MLLILITFYSLLLLCHSTSLTKRDIQTGSINALHSDALTQSSLDALQQFTTLSLNEIAEANQTSYISLSTVPVLLLKYYVQCALNPGQFWNVTINGTTLLVEGDLGLAPSLSSPPTLEQVRWLSACLMARVNYYKSEVNISVRSLLWTTTPEEEALYNVFEGSFFGNIFSNPQQKYVCQGTDKEHALDISPDRVRRVCTDSYDYCEFLVVGNCSDVCPDPVGPCYVNGTAYNEVIQVYLEGFTSGSVALTGASVLLFLFALLPNIPIF
jgi:hypothetical protein